MIPFVWCSPTRLASMIASDGGPARLSLLTCSNTRQNIALPVPVPVSLRIFLPLSPSCALEYSAAWAAAVCRPVFNLAEVLAHVSFYVTRTLSVTLREGGHVHRYGRCAPLVLQDAWRITCTGDQIKTAKRRGCQVSDTYRQTPKLIPRRDGGSCHDRRILHPGGRVITAMNGTITTLNMWQRIWARCKNSTNCSLPKN